MINSLLEEDCTRCIVDCEYCGCSHYDIEGFISYFDANKSFCCERCAELHDEEIEEEEE